MPTAALIDFESILEILNRRINEQYGVLKNRLGFFSILKDLNISQEIGALRELQKLINDANHKDCMLLLLKVRSLQAQVQYQKLSGFQGIAELAVKKCIEYLEAHIEDADFKRFKKNLCPQDLQLIQAEIYYLDRKLIPKIIERTIQWLKESKSLLQNDIVDPKELDRLTTELVIHYNTLIELYPPCEKGSGQSVLPAELYSDLLLFRCFLHQKRLQPEHTQDYDVKGVLTDFDRATRVIIDENDKNRFTILCEHYLNLPQIILPLAKKHFLILQPNHQLYSMAMGLLAKLYAFSPAKKSVEKNERRIFKALACATEWLDSAMKVSKEEADYQKNYILGLYKKISFNENLQSIEAMKSQHPYTFLRIQFELYVEKKKLKLPTDKLYLEILHLISLLKEKRQKQCPNISHLDIFIEAFETYDTSPDDFSELYEIVDELYLAFINVFNHPLYKALEAQNHAEVKKLFAQIKEQKLEVDFYGRNAEQQTLIAHLVAMKKDKALYWVGRFFYETKLNLTLNEDNRVRNLNSLSFVEKEQLEQSFSEKRESLSRSSSSAIMVFWPTESALKVISKPYGLPSVESSSTTSTVKKFVV